jgi:hypothetical protein
MYVRWGITDHGASNARCNRMRRLIALAGSLAAMVAPVQLSDQSMRI